MAVAIKDEDYAAIHNMVAMALTPDNERRQVAENFLFSQMRGAQIELLLACMLKLLRTHASSPEEEQMRCFVAVFMRNELGRGEPVVIDTLSDAMRELIKQEVFAAFLHEPSRTVRLQLANCIHEIASCLLHQELWEELIPQLFSLLIPPTPNPELRVTVFFLLGRLAESVSDCFDHHMDELFAVIVAGLKDTELLVRVQAVSCFALLLTSESDANEQLEKFPGILTDIMALLGSCLSGQHHTQAQTILKSLIDIAGTEATFFRKQLQQVCLCAGINGCSSSSDDGVRQLACEWLVAIAECKAAMVRKSKIFMKTAVDMALRLMLHVRDDPLWGERTTEINFYDENCFECGEAAVDRLLSVIGLKLVAVAMQTVTEFMTESAWQFRHAGLMAVSQLGESIDFDQLPWKALCDHATQDAHPRVRYAAIDALGQMSTDHAPEVQQRLSGELIPLFLSIFDNPRFPRLQAHAAAALYNFIVECEEEILEPFLPSIVQGLVRLVTQSPVALVQEQALNCLSCTAGSCPELFTQHYDSVVPLLKKIIFEATDKNFASIRARAMETVAYVGMAVGKERFRQDGLEIMASFLHTMSSHADADDISQQFMLKAWSKFCTLFSSEFVPVLPHLMPLVMASCAKEPDLSVLNSNDMRGMAGGVSEEAEHVTAVLEEKAQSIDMLRSFCHDLQADFCPYVGSTLTLLLPLLQYDYNEDIRALSVGTVSELVVAVTKGVNRPNEVPPLPPTCTPEFAKEVFSTIMEKLVHLMVAPSHSDTLGYLIGAIRACLLASPLLARECLSADAVGLMATQVMNVVAESCERVSELRTNARNDEDNDEEQEAYCEGQQVLEEELLSICAECLGAIIQAHKETFFPLFSEQILPELTKYLQNKKGQAPTMGQKFATYVVVDALEHFGELIGPLYSVLIPFLLAQCNPNCPPEIRQASAYGLSQACRVGGSLFAPYLDKTVKTLVAQIASPNARQPENYSVTDNQIGALVKIMRLHTRPDLMPGVLVALPLHEDETEAEDVHSYIVSLVEINDPVVLGGPTFANLPQLVRCLTQMCLSEITSMELQERIHALLRQMQTIGQPFNQAVNKSKLDKQSLQFLKSLLSS